MIITLENPTILNLSRLVNFRNKAVSIYLALMIFNFIPANLAKWGEMLDVNIHKTNKVVLALKRKKAKARTNAKKSNNTAYVRNPGVENVRVLDLGIQQLSTKILGCLPPPHSTWLKLIDMTIEEKYLELREKTVNRKNDRYLFTYLESRPKSLQYIALFKR